MIDESNFLTEFLAETNLLLAQIDYGNKLYDLISPVRNLLLKEKELLSFSMARYCGANARIGFFCEWYHQTLRLTNDTRDLVAENKSYFYKKIPLKLRGVPNIYQLVDYDIAIFVPQQLSLLQNKSKAILDALVTKHPYLSKYMNDNFLSQVMAAQYVSRKKKYSESMSITEYLDSQSYGDSFVKIAFPCLVGFCYSFNQKDSAINGDGIKWIILEEILKNISLLHQLSQDSRFEEFVYSVSLSEKEEFEWLQLDEKNRFQRILASPKTKDTVKSYKDKIFKSTSSTLDNINFPTQHKAMLKELLDWGYVG